MENATESQTLATVSVAFKRDGDATFEFQVTKDIKHPTSSDLAVIALAKIVSELVASIAQSEGIVEINEMIRAVAENADRNDTDA